MVRRKTKGVKWENQVCRAHESSLTPKQNGLWCMKCQNVGLLGGVWPSSCERALLPSDSFCVVWELLQFSLRGTWRQRG